jgi:NAD(P)-dependent dehydrogenase (short-subunit alcohol dehydrogenase family)
VIRVARLFFNNAGILGWISTLFDYSEEQFDEVRRANVKGE